MSDPILACNPKALTPAERAAHAGVTAALLRQVQAVVELPDGYALRLAAEAGPVALAAEFIARERRCCPFFSFQLAVEPAGSPAWLSLTGPAGVKPLLQAELNLAASFSKDTLPMTDQPQATIRESVREHYAQRARAADSCCGPSSSSSCCSNSLYPADLTADLPADVAEFSLGCGDPITLAGLQPGDVVVDLGSGGGIDCFMAAKKVGAAGRVIGVDMTPDMLAKARANAAKLEAANVEFREGYIEALPVDAASADVVISNCVINLSPDKPQVFREIFRVLRPGGRVAVSDIVTNGPLPAVVARSLEAWGACVAGALDLRDYAAGLEAAGFVDVKVEPKGKFESGLSHLPVHVPFSALITARKP